MQNKPKNKVLKEKILLAAPIYSGKDYTMAEWISNIKVIADFYGLDVALCDNTNDNGEYSDKIKKMCPSNWTITHVSRESSSQSAITKSQNALREHFLNGNYDRYLSIEADVYPPINLLDRMVVEMDKCKADIYSGVYFIDHKENSYPMLQSLFIFRNDDGSIMDAMAYNHSFQNMFLGHKFSASPQPIFACGFGCALINRSVLEKIEYRDDGASGAHSDSFFYQDCARAGFKAYFDSQIICNHDNFDWKM